MPNFVQEYRSTDVPAWPNLTGQSGMMTALLDAVLVTGGPTSSVTSLTENGLAITALISANTTLETGDWLTIAGASPAAANGTFKVTAIDSTHFNYTGPGGLGTITGGSITYKRAALGWSKPSLGGTNPSSTVSVYQPAAVAGFPQHLLRIEESGLTIGVQRDSLATGYETMSDVNTGTNQFPITSQVAINGTIGRSGVCWRKSSSADGTIRPWFIIGDGATFYIVVNSDNSAIGGRAICGFGGYNTFKVGDLFNTFISGQKTFNDGAPTNGLSICNPLSATYNSVLNVTGVYGARGMSQIGGSIILAHFSRGTTTATLGGATAGFVDWPNPVDGSLWVDSTFLAEAQVTPRGRTRGIYHHCHSAMPTLNDYDIVSNIAGLPGITLLAMLTNANSNAGMALFDKFGPW